MNTYEQKQADRKARLEAAADRAEARANAAYAKADLREEVSGIPFGQPILVGHHSERRHRKAIERAENAVRKSIKESNRAGELRAKADAVGSGGISSDDPDAIDKLRAELEKREGRQMFMRKANAILRKALKAGVTHESDDEAIAAWAGKIKDATEREIGVADMRGLLTPGFCNHIGFHGFEMTNNNASIKRIQQRIAQLEKMASAPAREYQIGGVQIVENPDAGRVQIVFDGKPSAEVRTVLKSRGFRWSPSEGAWQRMLNNAGRFAAKCAAEEIGGLG